MARSAGVFPDVERCVVALRALQQALAAGSGSVSVAAVGGLWSWLLTLDGIAVAVASRLYQRQRECDYNCRVFLAAGPRAELMVNPPAARETTTSGAVVAAE